MSHLPIATRLAGAMLAVGAVALAVIGIGVLRAGADSFAALMMAAGDTAAEAQAMFDQSVGLVLALAALLAAAIAGLLAWLLARRLAHPIERLAAAADRIAEGDLGARVAVEGPPELQSLAAAYNTMAERLAEQDALRREFVVNASHELRTPLTNLQGYLEALRDGVLAPDPALFDSLREEVDRLTRLAASLDVLAGSGAPRPAATRTDLAAVVRSSAELVAPALSRRSIRLEVDAGEPVIVEAHSDELAQVMANLLQNAARYTPEGGRVRVSVARSSDGATVTVANTGSLIPPGELPRIWERFYRVEKSRNRETGGAGIGLAIVKQLVEAAGGRVGAASDEAVTTFWFSLPTGRRPA